ncbi:hypothetical protein GNI_164370 [Gregarina niphandrodes]|uniref:Uncharacterized protein n=1 Tax=Gregarina niphandrodes TaxID=110365 RepID=A0A023AY84_GRENI|nr:hypothetical protein GNI_164370 [Gregarina niphandrodes]EZG43614.1 hypothetical protein GNI_164370 [Gregarina niphandrodes]|eukprot:XP_011133142.1 hypothetical protein GNI_164370 [Gregarina niphandrodes]
MKSTVATSQSSSTVLLAAGQATTGLAGPATAGLTPVASKAATKKATPVTPGSTVPVAANVFNTSSNQGFANSASTLADVAGVFKKMFGGSYQRIVTKDNEQFMLINGKERCTVPEFLFTYFYHGFMEQTSRTHRLAESDVNVMDLMINGPASSFLSLALKCHNSKEVGNAFKRMLSNVSAKFPNLRYDEVSDSFKYTATHVDTTSQQRKNVEAVVESAYVNKFLMYLRDFNDTDTLPFLIDGEKGNASALPGIFDSVEPIKELCDKVNFDDAYDIIRAVLPEQQFNTMLDRADRLMGTRKQVDLRQELTQTYDCVNNYRTVMQRIGGAPIELSEKRLAVRRTDMPLMSQFVSVATRDESKILMDQTYRLYFAKARAAASKIIQEGRRVQRQAGKLVSVKEFVEGLPSAMSGAAKATNAVEKDVETAVADFLKNPAIARIAEICA